jgi:hypothetical protein
LVTGFDAIYELFDRAVTTLFALAAVPALCALPLSGTTRFKFTASGSGADVVYERTVHEHEFQHLDAARHLNVTNSTLHGLCAKRRIAWRDSKHLS